MGEARNFKFGVLIDLGKSHLMSDKVPLKWAWSWSRVEFLNFKPFRKFGTDDARNFKFSIRIDLGKSHLTSDQMPPKGA